jgi:hypothetical protein
LLPAGQKNVLAWAEVGEPPHFAKHGIQSRTAERLAFQLLPFILERCVASGKRQQGEKAFP